MTPPRPAFRVTARTRGFTLIELLTVVAIIGVLVAVVLAGIGQARKTARASADMGTMRSLGQAMLQYSAENKGLINVWGYETGKPTTIANTFWGRAWPYLRNTQLTQLSSSAMREVADTYLATVIENDRPDLIANADGINYTIAINNNFYTRDASGYITTNTRVQNVARPSSCPYLVVGKWGFWSLTPAELPASQPSEGAYWPYAGNKTAVVNLDGSTSLSGQAVAYADLRTLSR